LAEPVPELEEILDALEDSALGAFVLPSRVAIAAMPQADRTAEDLRLIEVEAQFDTVFETLLAPLKFELEATTALAEVAEHLGVTDIRIEGDTAENPAGLTSPARREALEAMIKLLKLELEDARQRARTGSAPQ